MPDVSVHELVDWTEYKYKKHFMSTLRALHKKRWIEFTESTGRTQILPPGTNEVERLVREKNLSGIV